MILDGTCASGARLPATRALADDLGESRNIVLLAYRQLTISANTGACTVARVPRGEIRPRWSIR